MVTDDDSLSQSSSVELYQDERSCEEIKGSESELDESEDSDESFCDDGARVAGELRGLCDIFKDMPHNTLVKVKVGTKKDLNNVGIKKHVPSTEKFRIFTFKNPHSKRVMKILKCDHRDCLSRSDASSRYFRKWHNFFDHLRIHTGEKPYKCTYPQCKHSFTQKANLNKHVEVHLGVKRFACSRCPRTFFTNFNMNSHLKTHQR